jgi:DAACS family dicarboxylate/amino acid:cation (Na+ or H+) symporter
LVTGNGNYKLGGSLHTKILVGFVLGAMLGLLANQSVALGVLSSARLDWFIANVTTPVGQIFLDLLFMVVFPIVFSSIALGVS